MNASPNALARSAPAARLDYSQVWEDPEIAASGLGLGPDDDLVAVASAGDNVMALSLYRPRSITAVDSSPAQCALLELKLASLRSLSWADYAAFLGARPSFHRLSTYRDRVRRELGDPARAVFDRLEPMIARGVIHGGRFQRYLGGFRRAVLPLIHGRAVVEELMTIADRGRRERYHREVWDNRRWRALFKAYFSDAVVAGLGRARSRRGSALAPSLGARLLERATRALVETSPRDNHFLQYALLGGYPDLERGPIYLRESCFAALRDATSGLRVVNGDLEAHLTTLGPGAVSRLYLSDVPASLEDGRHRALRRAIAAVARPGARLVSWSPLAAADRPALAADAIVRLDDESRELSGRDHAFVYEAFHVESVP